MNPILSPEAYKSLQACFDEICEALERLTESPELSLVPFDEYLIPMFYNNIARAKCPSDSGCQPYFVKSLSVSRLRTLLSAVIRRFISTKNTKIKQHLRLTLTEILKNS